jgi:hypothetical protein
MQMQTNQADILFQNNTKSSSNQNGGLRGDGLSRHSDEDISESEQREIEKNASGKL